VVQQARFLLSEDHDPASPVGEAFEHVSPFVPMANACVHSIGAIAGCLDGEFRSTERVATDRPHSSGSRTTVDRAGLVFPPSGPSA
jgi:hypothetical protein